MVSYMRTGIFGTTDVVFVIVMGVRRCVFLFRVLDFIVVFLCLDWAIVVFFVLVSIVCF